RVASVAAAARDRRGRRRRDAERLPRSRASQLDPQLRPVRARRRAGVAGARHRRATLRSHSEVHLMMKPSFLRGCGAVVCGLLTMTSTSFAATKAIRAGTVVDPSGKPITNAVIVVENDRIVSVGSAAPPTGAEVIDLSRF